MDRKLIVSAAVMIVMALGLSYVVHGPLLGSEDAVTAGTPRAKAQGLVPFLIVAQVLFGFAFAWVYVQGKEGKPWFAHGLRYGIAMAFLTVVPTYLTYRVLTPVPLALAEMQIVLVTIRVMLMGVVLAWINR